MRYSVWPKFCLCPDTKDEFPELEHFTEKEVGYILEDLLFRDVRSLVQEEVKSPVKNYHGEKIYTTKFTFTLSDTDDVYKLQVYPKRGHVDKWHLYITNYDIQYSRNGLDIACSKYEGVYSLSSMLEHLESLPREERVQKILCYAPVLVFESGK
nr:hypothetical protein Cbor_11 [Cedratvirus borely]